MRRLDIVILDLVARGRGGNLYDRLMRPNLVSIMPQVVAVWCEEEGHQVRLICYTGFEDLSTQLPRDADLLIISAFSTEAQLSYAISNLVRQSGVVTALGGPHARCYPQDAQKYFDYVFGLTDKDTLKAMLTDCRPHRPLGARLSAKRHPLSLPGVKQRWKFIEPNLAKAPFIKIVPMIGSLGCPYTCSFCIDSVVPYQPLDFEEIRDDLRFLVTRMKRPWVAWHDPNFGVRFDDYMNAIEEAVPPGSVSFLAESTLSLLAEPHLQRLQRNSFKAILPGVESWYDMGNKSKTGKSTGRDKVRLVSDHANLILRYIPYLQTNFVLGLDSDQGSDPFELTKEFVGMAPGSLPVYSLLTAYGQAAPLNLQYQKSGRILGFPFHFLNNHDVMNVRPLHYEWPRFYDYVIDLTRHTYSLRAILRRWGAMKEAIPRWTNVVRAISSEGPKRIRYFQTVRRLLDDDRSFRRYFEQETDELPAFFEERVKRDLGWLWPYLPSGALQHDPQAYLKEQSPGNDVLVPVAAELP